MERLESAGQFVRILNGGVVDHGQAAHHRRDKGRVVSEDHVVTRIGNGHAIGVHVDPIIPREGTGVMDDVRHEGDKRCHRLAASRRARKCSGNIRLQVGTEFMSTASCGAFEISSCGLSVRAG